MTATHSEEQKLAQTLFFMSRLMSQLKGRLMTYNCDSQRTAEAFLSQISFLDQLEGRLRNLKQKVLVPIELNVKLFNISIKHK